MLRWQPRGAGRDEAAFMRGSYGGVVAAPRDDPGKPSFPTMKNSAIHKSSFIFDIYNYVIRRECRRAL